MVDCAPNKEQVSICLKALFVSSLRNDIAILRQYRYIVKYRPPGRYVYLRKEILYYERHLEKESSGVGHACCYRYTHHSCDELFYSRREATRVIVITLGTTTVPGVIISFYLASVQPYNVGHEIVV